MKAGKGPDREQRKDAAIVDGLLENLFFGDAGSKGNPGQPRPSGSAPHPTQPISQQRPPALGAPKPILQKRPSVPAASVAQPGGNGRVGTWGRISLGVVIAVGMLQWPYDHSCGLKLGFYLTAVAVVLVSAGWGSAFSWKNRMPIAHSVSQMLLLWGFILGAGQVLPRVGYAKDLATWRCVAAPAPVAPAMVPAISPEPDVADEGAIPAEEGPPTVPDSSS